MKKSKQTFQARPDYRRDYPLTVPVGPERCVKCGATFAEHKRRWADRDSARLVYVCPIQPEVTR